jgi:hypothetical protein
MSSWKTLNWDEDDIAYQSERAFWGLGMGQDWAELMWNFLKDAQLTRYQTELERCQLKIHVMALADFYHDFCWIAYQEPQDVEYMEWAEKLKICEFRIGQMMSSEPDFESEDCDGYSLANTALSELICDARARILPILSKLVGGEINLLKSLMYYSSYYKNDEVHSPEDIHISPSFGAMETYTWLQEQIQ